MKALKLRNYEWLFCWVLLVPLLPSFSFGMDCNSLERQYFFGGLRSFRELVREYSEFEATTPTENKAYLKLAYSSEASGHVFLHVDLKPLKELNDKVFVVEGSFGKEGVNAVEGLYRKIFQQFLKSNPMLAEHVAAQYSDFKTVRLAFLPNKFHSERLIAEAQSLGVAVNHEFALRLGHILKSAPNLAQKISGQSSVISKISQWHQVGVAHSSADLAAAFARHSSYTGASRVADRAIALAKEIKNIEVIRSRLAFKYGDSILFEGFSLADGAKVLSPQLLDIMRKLPREQSNSPQLLEFEISRRHGIKLRPGEARMFLDYFKRADIFSPSILISERIRLDLSGADHGLMSIDFAGQGVYNMYYVMTSLSVSIKNSGDLSNLAAKTVDLVRKSEIEYSTPRLRSLRSNIESMNRIMVKGQVKFTGDDGVIIPNSELSRSSKHHLLRSLGRSLTGRLADYRVVFLESMRSNQGELQGAQMSMEIATKGEAFEKLLRAKLYDLIPSEVLEKLIFAIDLYPSKEYLELVVGGDYSNKEIKAITHYLNHSQALPAGYRSFKVVPLARL
jgi:hypothetical protein